MSKNKKKALGTGMETLIRTTPEETDVEKLESDTERESLPSGKPLEIRVSDIKANPDQPRKNFPADELSKLVHSIKDKGILEPLIAFKTDTGYQLVAGHRRLMAAQQAGFETVPVIIRDRKGEATEDLELGLIENIIRQDLNPIEEAEALEKLENQYKKETLSIARLVGKDTTTVKNSIRLLKLPEPVKQDIREGRLSSGHGKVLLSLDDREDDLMACRNIILSKSLTVRQSTALVKKYVNKGKRKSVNRDQEEKAAYFESLARSISDAINGLKVEIVYQGRKKQVIINYINNENLEYLLKIFNVTVQS